LIAKANEMFQSLPYNTEFIVGDIDELRMEERKYDAAVCHALLLHMTDPRETLRKIGEKR
jgi:ubiquinone/menaquinone biosynthesis C-methylase UbiE